MKILYIIPLLIIWGCSSPTSNPPPADNLNSINISPISYNNILIQDGENLIVSSRNIKSILAGELKYGVFLLKDSISYLYINDGDQFKIKFMDTLEVPSNQINIDVEIIISRENEDDFVIDKNISMLRSVYKSAAMFNDLTRFYNKGDIQDFAIMGDKVYYHPFGPLGLYEYDLETKKNKLLNDYQSGDVINANSSYIYLDVNHFMIYRYNLNADAIDPQISFQSSDRNNYIRGIAATDSIIYCFFYNNTILFSSNLIIKKDTNIALPVSSCSFYKGKIYAVSYDYSELMAIDPNSLQILDNYDLPTAYTNAIKIYNDSLYFVDYTKNCMGVVPLNEILALPVKQKSRINYSVKNNILLLDKEK